MAKKPREPGAAQCKTFRELAHRMGYSPAELLIERRLETAELIASLKRCVALGVRHEDFPGMDVPQMKDMLSKEILSAGKMDLEMMPFEFGKISSIEHSGPDGGSIKTDGNWTVTIVDPKS